MMQRSSRTRNQHRDGLWLVLIVLLGLALRLYRLGEQSLWFDEAFSWMIASLPVEAGLQRALADFVHPPLYYLLLHPVMFLSQNEFALRLPSALLGTLSIPLIYRLARDLDSGEGWARDSGLLAAGLLALNPFHIWFSREARNYQLVFFLSLLLLHLFHQLLQGRRRWLAFTLVSALAYINHYFATLLVPVQFLYFLIKYRRRYRLLPRWLLAQVVAAIPLLVWLITLLSQEKWHVGTAWIPKPRLATPLLTLWDFALLYAEGWLSWGVFALLPFALILLLGLTVRRRRTLLLLWLVVPILILLAMSWPGEHSFYVDRHLIISLPAFVLLLARGLVVLGERVPRPRWLAGAAAAVLLLGSALSVGQIYWDTGLAKTDWRGVAHLLEASLQSSELVVLRGDAEMVPVRYYLAEPEWTSLTDEPTPESWAQIEAGARQIWLVWSNSHAYNHLTNQSLPVDVYAEADPVTRAWLEAHRDQIVAEHTLPGVVVLQVTP